MLMEYTWRDRLSDALFNTTLGSIFIGVLCIFLFIITFGIGYILIGMLLLLHGINKNPDGIIGSIGYGIIFAWPAAILIMLVEGRSL